MRTRWFGAIVALPLPVVVVIPGALVVAFRHSRWTHAPASPSEPLCWIAIGLGALGVAVALWSASVFARFGAGTPAPWDPPERFVVYGPYRFVRNPMILGVFVVLLAEAALLRSPPLFVWCALFVVGNLLYIPLVEEKSLRRRFGDAYESYQQDVPRWFPRWTTAQRRSRY